MRKNINDYFAGDSLVIEHTATDGTGAVLDLTDATIRWAVGPYSQVTGIGDAEITKTIGEGITVDADPTTGKFTVTLAAGELTKPGNYYHEAEVNLDDGRSITVFHGSLRAAPVLLTNEGE